MKTHVLGMLPQVHSHTHLVKGIHSHTHTHTHTHAQILNEITMQMYPDCEAGAHFLRLWMHVYIYKHLEHEQVLQNIVHTYSSIDGTETAKSRGQLLGMH